MLRVKTGMKKGYTYGFRAVESVHVRAEARRAVGAWLLLQDDIQLQIVEVIGRIIFEEMQEVSRE